jgi:hypothetical protein
LKEVKTDWDPTWGFKPDGTPMTNKQMVEFMRNVDDYISKNYGFRVWGKHGDHLNYLLRKQAGELEGRGFELWGLEYTDGPVDVFSDAGKVTGPMFDMYAKFWRYLGP